MCQPDPFKFYMDKRSGDLYSGLIVDADNDDLMSKQRELYNNNSSFYYDNLVEIKCTFKVADSNGKETVKKNR